MELDLEPGRVTRVFVWIVIFLMIAHSVGQIFFLTAGPDHDLAFVRSKFDLDGEKNIPALYSSAAMLFCAALLAMIGQVKRNRRESFVFHWRLLAVVFLALAIDESIAFHESFQEPMASLLHLKGLLYVGWVVPVGIALVALLLICIKFIASLPPRTRTLFIVAGAVYVFGAAVMEMVGGSYLFSIGGTDATKAERGVAWAAYVLAEEGIEMAGVVIFIHALLLYIARELGGLKVRIPPRAP